jgi:hypothetical protein
MALISAITKSAYSADILESKVFKDSFNASTSPSVAPKEISFKLEVHAYAAPAESCEASVIPRSLATAPASLKAFVCESRISVKVASYASFALSRLSVSFSSPFQP